MDQQQVSDLLNGDFAALCGLVVAEATGQVSGPVRQALRSPRWVEDWRDALLAAESELQVAVFCADPDRPDADGDRAALAAVRARLFAARDLVKRRRREVLADPGHADPATRRATEELIRRYRADFALLLSAELATAGHTPDLLDRLPQRPPELARWALRHDVESVPRPSARVRELAALSDAMFLQVVDEDVRWSPEEPELTHPLLLDRWERALSDLAEIATGILGIPLWPLAGITDTDLTHIPPGDDDRTTRFRLLVRIRQRWLEQGIHTRRLRYRIEHWRNRHVMTAREAARSHLRQTHLYEYSTLLTPAATASAPAAPASTRVAAVPAPAATPARAVPPRPTPAVAAVPAVAGSVSAPVPLPVELIDFRDRVRELGWTATIGQDPGGELRLNATLGQTATIRLVLPPGDPSRAGRLRVRFRIAGQAGWTPLPGLADALTMAAQPAFELPGYAERLRSTLPIAVTRNLPTELLDFRDRLRDLGWDTGISRDGAEIRLDATRGLTATIGASFRRKRDSLGHPGIWSRSNLSIYVTGQAGWTALPTVDQALELAALPPDELSRRIRHYRHAIPALPPRRTTPIRIAG
ncbi:hypothetical protein [Actinoplanes sp. NPDC051851]|uniref:hypothetical protein n=1 Tax=Actinoplanes sp. NPDC051851 TaxID=3154753 RepID=UPI00342EA5C7